MMKQEIRQMKKIIVTAVTLAALAASPAFAKTHHAQALNAQASSESSAYEPAYVAASPYAVIVGGQVVGADPDPNIRAQIERDPAPADF
jgi:hypothetical protein